ncbi:carboxylesterase 5A-like [Gigantopelta aegis]|uniref:carboxylesterase 5A-like n=1 Tax=Gigantopelta aegis TaxID=1735272 RepID=UPI001B8877F5|nr:carboxylesterase 5A-like [Gigantopelta aegis]
MCAVLKSAVILNAMFIVCVLCNKPIAETTKGQVAGFKKDVDGQDVYLSMGIPYAKPPTAMRRFKPPESPDTWKATGVLNATHAKPSCPQKKEMVKMALGSGFAIEEISEDCLYLNVYTPTKKQPMKSDSLAVIFFLHGGGFQMGSGTLWDYSILARYANVVVVSINYRLGVLGFLATEDSAASGNWGLLDQRMALQWTQDNIENFGGDKTRVTLLGHAAGAYSVGLHIMSPMSRGLFKRAISQAGTIKSPALLNTNTLRRVKPLAMMVKCLPRGTAFDSKKVVACLRKVPFSELLKHDAHTSGKFTATVDGHFLPADPIELLRQGNYVPVDYIMGGNSDEGSSVAAKIPNFYKGDGLNKTDFEKYISNAVPYALTKPIPDAAKSALRAVISAKYFPREVTPSAFRKAYLSALGEVILSMMMKNAHYYSNKGTVFLYKFTHRPSNARFPKYVGAGHTEELQFIFGYILKNGTNDEKRLSADWMKTWGDFARTG